MRLYIGKYLQEELLKFEGLDMTDIALLEYLDDFKNSGAMKEYIKDNKSWNWINWNKVSSDMPILNVTVDALKKRFLYKLGVKPKDFDERYEKASESYKKKMKNYKFFGLLEFKTIVQNNVEITIFRFTEKYYKLKIPFNTDSLENKKDLSAPTDKPNEDNKNLDLNNVNNSIPCKEEDMQILLNSGFTKKDIKSMTINQIENAIYRLRKYRS